MLKHNVQYDRIKKYDWVWGDGLIGKSACHIHIKTWLQIPRTYIKGGQVVYVSVIRSLLTRRWEVGMRNLQKLMDQLTWNIQKTTKNPVTNKVEGEDQHLRLFSDLHMPTMKYRTHSHTWDFRELIGTWGRLTCTGFVALLNSSHRASLLPLPLGTQGESAAEEPDTQSSGSFIFLLLDLVRSEFPLFVVVSCLGLCV